MSTTIISSAAVILSQLLPLLGIDIGSEELQTTIQTIVAIAGGLWIWKERVKKGDVSPLGVRKK